MLLFCPCCPRSLRLCNLFVVSWLSRAGHFCFLTACLFPGILLIQHRMWETKLQLQPLWVMRELQVAQMTRNLLKTEKSQRTTKRRRRRKLASETERCEEQNKTKKKKQKEKVRPQRFCWSFRNCAAEISLFSCVCFRSLSTRTESEITQHQTKYFVTLPLWKLWLLMGAVKSTWHLTTLWDQSLPEWSNQKVMNAPLAALSLCWSLSVKSVTLLIFWWARVMENFFLQQHKFARSVAVWCGKNSLKKFSQYFCVQVRPKKFLLSWTDLHLPPKILRNEWTRGLNTDKRPHWQKKCYFRFRTGIGLVSKIWPECKYFVLVRHIQKSRCPSFRQYFAVKETEFWLDCQKFESRETIIVWEVCLFNYLFNICRLKPAWAAKEAVFFPHLEKVTRKTFSHFRCKCCWAQWTPPVFLDQCRFQIFFWAVYLSECFVVQSETKPISKPSKVKDTVAALAAGQTILHFLHFSGSTDTLRSSHSLALCLIQITCELTCVCF